MPADRPDPDALILMGRVGKPHGVRGAIKVVPDTDDPARFGTLDTVYLGPAPEDAAPHALTDARVQPTKRGPLAVLSLADVTDRDAADALRGYDVYAHEDDLPLDEGEVFLHDLLGARILDESGEELGTLKDIYETAAHDLFVVARPGKADALVPAVDAFIVSLDVDEIVLRPVEGLL